MGGRKRSSPSNPVRKIRQALHLTQTEFAARVGISQPTISELETGSTPLTEHHIRQITSGVSPDVGLMLIAHSAKMDLVRQVVGETLGRQRSPEFVSLIAQLDSLDEQDQPRVLAYFLAMLDAHNRVG